MTPVLRRLPVAIATVVILIAGTLLDTPAAMQGRRARSIEIVSGREAVAGEVLVRFNGALTEPEWRAIERTTEAERHYPSGGRGARVFRSRRLDTRSLLALLARRPDVLYVEPNYIVRLATPPDDPQFPNLWGLRNIGQAVNGGAAGRSGADIRATSAWDVSTGDRAKVVAVIDTGIDYTHPDLAANIWSASSAFTVTIGGVAIVCPPGSHGFDAIAGVCDPMDDHDHGTHVAGTIGAAGGNGLGVAGVNWTASLLGAKFIGPDGTGTIADAVDAIEFLIQTKQAFAATGGADIRVLSNSWGGSEFSQALRDQIARAHEHDMLFVAAAGNNGLPNDWFPMYPASYDEPNVIAVAATTNTDTRASFSNYGGASVHLGAPGVDILSTVRHDQYRFASGTSMATPHVSGAAALVLSACSLDTAGVKSALLDNVDVVPGLSGLTTTGGRLNVDKAIRACSMLPDRPANLSAVAGNATVTLAWAAASGATTYSVKRSLTAGGGHVVLASGVRTTGYTDSTAVNDTTYHYVVSGVNMVGESDPSTEVSATPRVPPDLVVPALNAPSKGGAGLTLSVSVTTGNTAAAAALDPTQTKLYLSTDYVIDTGDVTLDGSQSVPPLTSGAVYNTSVTVTIPSGTSPGTYFLIAKADGDHRVLETSENNNTRSSLLTIGPDLIVSTLTVPASAAPGSTILAADTVRNQGGGSAGESILRFHLSTNASFDTGDVLLTGSRTIPALPAGTTSSGSTTVTIPAGIATGSYYVIGRIDADNVVTETSEANNTVARVIQVGPDLIVSAITGPSAAGPGGSIVVTDSVRNQGSSDAGPSTTRFYFSIDHTADEGDALLAGARSVPALAPGVTSTGSSALTIPPGTSTGTYYVIAAADAGLGVAETQEGNNTRSHSIRVGPDLTTPALSAPSAAAAGAGIIVTETVRNQGGGAAGATTTWFYLSTDAVFDPGDSRLEGTRSVPALAEGGSSGGSCSVTIPAGTTVGTYYLIAHADGSGGVDETSETNNTAARSLRVGPDLTIVFGTMPSARAAGTPLTIIDTVTNQGTGVAAASTTRYYLSRDVFLSADDQLLDGVRAVGPLGAGAASPGQTTVMIPAGTGPAQYYLIAEADGEHVVVESLETNNKAVRGLQVTGG